MNPIWPRQGTALLAIACFLALASPGSAAATGINTISSPDTADDVGIHSSQVLDAVGNPVVSYYDQTNDALKILHCNDPACVGGDESIVTPDSAGDVGRFPSIVLDSSGNPVISYLVWSDFDLRIMHCNDPNCTGGDESIETPDTVGDLGGYNSLALDASGNPVVSYYHWTDGDLKVLHCNDPNCAGGDESITVPDPDSPTQVLGIFSSLALDPSGNPVISYTQWLTQDLRVMHCNDPNCAGGGENVASPDTVGDVGSWTSLKLDGSGKPVVAYRDDTNRDLKLLRCGNVNCSSGNVISSPDGSGNVGRAPALALDEDGLATVSYRDDTAATVKLLHCGSTACDGANVTTYPDGTSAALGLGSYLVLDAFGNPVMSYYDATNGDLKILHCGTATCSKASVGGIAELAGPDRLPKAEDVGSIHYVRVFARLRAVAIAVLPVAVMGALWWFRRRT